MKSLYKQNSVELKALRIRKVRSEMNRRGEYQNTSDIII